MSTVLPSPQADHAEFKDYAGLLSAAHRAFSPEIKSLMRNLPLANARRVLDVPSGDGFYSELLARQLPAGGEVVAADLEKEALEQVAKRSQNLPGHVALTSVSADVDSLPFPEESFDFAWCAQSLISLAEPQETPEGPGIRNSLREIHRVLKPGGEIALLEQDAMHYVLLPWPAELELALQTAHRKGFARMHGHPEQLHVGRQLGKLLAKAGFQPLRKITLSADRHGTPNGYLAVFLQAYFRELRSRVRRDLSRDELQEFNRLTDPESEESFFQDPQFEMTCLEAVFLGRKV